MPCFAGLALNDGQMIETGPFCPDVGTVLYEIAARCLQDVTGSLGGFRGDDVAGKTLEQTLTTDQFWKSYCPLVDHCNLLIITPQ